MTRVLVWETWSAFCNIQKNAIKDMREAVKSNWSSSRDEYAYNSKKEEESTSVRLESCSDYIRIIEIDHVESSQLLISQR
jgi:hypothetical protein